MSENANIRKEADGWGLNLDNFKVEKEMSENANIRKEADGWGLNLDNFKVEKEMSENANIRKEADGWGLNLDNFKVEKELTVEITLNEYRALVSQRASHSDEMRKKTEELSKVKRELTDRIKGLLSPDDSSDDE